MSDQANIVDIVLRMKSEGKGDAEIAQKLEAMGAHANDVKAAFDELSQSSKSLADAMADVREESERDAKARRDKIENATQAAIADEAQADGLEKLEQATKKVEGAQSKLTPEITKGLNAKNEYRQAVKGLALEFPILARVMGLLANPLTAVAVVLGTVLGLMKRYSDSVREAGIAAQEMEKMATTANALAAAHSELARATADFEESFARIATDADNATTKLNEYNRALLLKQQLEQELADAELAQQIQGISKNPKLSDAQKLDEIAKAQSAARVRKRDREEATLQAQADANAMAAHGEAERAKQLKSQAAAINPQIAPANTAAEAAAKEAAGFPESQKKAREENARLLEMVRRLQEAGKGGTTAIAGTLALHPLDAKLLADKYPPGPGRNLETIEQELLVEQKGFDSKAEAVAQRAKDKAQTASDLAKEKARLEAEASAAEKSNQDKAATARGQYGDLETRRSYRKRIEPTIEDTEAEKARDAREHANRSAQDEFNQQDEEFDLYQQETIRAQMEGRVAGTFS